MFTDRWDAGSRLLERLRRFELEHPIVCAVARGGVVVGAAVADGLSCGLEVVVPRKLPHPHNEELAIGAVTEDGTVLVDDEALRNYGISQAYLASAKDRALAESQRRASLYRSGRQPVSAHGLDAIVVDDGIATGFTLLAAAGSVKVQRPRRLVIAVPVGPTVLPQALHVIADDLVVLEQPEPFYAVGQAYVRFDQVDDATVIALLARRRPARTPSCPANQ